MKVQAKHSITIRLVNNPGCVIRVALILERRGYAIESLQMKSPLDGYSEMNLVIIGEQEKFEQVQKQLTKLIDVMSVREGIREERSQESSWRKTLARSLSIS